MQTAKLISVDMPAIKDQSENGITDLALLDQSTASILHLGYINQSQESISNLVFREMLRRLFIQSESFI